MRVLCLGLDGADYDLVCKLLAQGRLPTLAGLSRQGTFGALRSTIPAFTPTAWSSFLTGLNPGGHGIFAFTSNPNRGGGRLENAASRAGAPLWRYLGAAGIRSAFVTVPFTHPPEPLNGIIVTGFGGPPRPCTRFTGRQSPVDGTGISAAQRLPTASGPLGSWPSGGRGTLRTVDPRTILSRRGWRSDLARLIAAGLGTVIALSATGWPGGAAE